MAPISLYDVTIPVFIRSLQNLSNCLKKGAIFADEKGISHSQLLSARLAPDMAALPYQIQRVSDTAKFTAVRIGGVESVSMDDNEVTFEDCQARIQKTIEFLEKVKPEEMEGKEDEEIIVKRGAGELKSTGKAYVTNFALPNFFFHVTTAYAILRNQGVPVGKADYLGRYD